jgi:trk system potassium uptake protein TrkH
LTNATLILTIILMAIGAGPCSTAGGFKVSTLGVLVLYAWSRFRGDEHINSFRRTISPETAGRALVVTMVFLVMINVGLIALLVAEQADTPHHMAQEEFLDAMFEVVSALGTVGLSTGITPELNDASKVILILLMFMGRLGPISIFLAVSRAEKKSSLEFAREEPLLG